MLRASWVPLVVKNPLANAGDTREVGSIPGSGRCPGGGNGYPLQYSCLENPMDSGAWRATVHSVASQTRLKGLSMQHAQKITPTNKRGTQQESRKRTEVASEPSSLRQRAQIPGSE